MLDKLKQALWHASGTTGAAALTSYAAFRSLRREPVNGTGLDVWFLTEGDPVKDYSPAARYRAFQYIPLLEELGLHCHVKPSRPGKYFCVTPGFHRLQASLPRASKYWARLQYLRQIVHRAFDFSRAAGHGVVFLQRDLLALSHSNLEAYLPLFNRRIVYDFDDAIFRSPSWCLAPGQADIDRELEDKIARICGLAATVIVANEWLAGWASKHNADVRVVPTTLDTAEFRPAAEPPRNDVPVVGWVGTSGNLYYLRQIAPALVELAKRRRFVLRVICNQVPHSELPEIPAANLEFVEWQADGEVERIQRFDVGIMPLADDDWTKGKAGFKLIQYMACGVPTVWSPVGANPEVAGDDGACGFAAKDTAGWVHALERLLDDAELRRGCGARGRTRAVERYDRRVWAPRIAAILEEAGDHG